MNLIRIFGFFIGLLIALILISYLKINEPFTDISSILSTPKIKALIETTTSVPIINDNDDSIIPYKGYKFMCINTYNDTTKISMTDGKWYDIDTDDLYFKFEKLISLDKNYINKKIGSVGANINTIQLNGPESFYFANNNENYEVKEFTMFMTIKIISTLNNNNILFELTGNTTTIDKLIPKYTTSIININFINNQNNKYDIVLLIGDNIYKGLANDIDKDIVENSNYLIVGLYYKKDKIGLIFNNKIYEYENITKYEITLGSTPIIINKFGSFNMHLYNFIYYKTLFDFQYYDYFVRYNNYYLSGLHNKACIETKTLEKEKPKISDEFEKIILPEFKYPMLEKYYTNYKKNFFELFKSDNINPDDTYIKKDIEYINNIK
jgi:hypothetical protein